MQHVNDQNRILLRELVEESLEALAEVSRLLVTLESNPTDSSLVNALFRPVHSLKSNAAFFGLFRIKELAHALESILDGIRSQKLTVTKSIVNVLLEGIDALCSMLIRVNNGELEIDNKEKFDLLLQHVQNNISGLKDTPGQIIKDILPSMLQLRDTLAVSNPAAAKTLAQVIDKLSSVNGINLSGNKIPSTPLPAAMVELHALLEKPVEKIADESTAKKVQQLLQQLHSDSSIVGHDTLKKSLDDFAIMTATVGFDNLLRELILDNLEVIRKDNSWQMPETSSRKEPTTATQSQTPSNTDYASKSKKTMRVEEERIDEFLAYVGELIVVRDMLDYTKNRFVAMTIEQSIIDEFTSIINVFEELSHKLQQSIMAIRKVPMRVIFQKIPRIARDTASTLGKEINVDISGEDIGVDKSIIDAIEMPIVHLIRNAVDHGLEVPDERAAAGKDTTGTLAIRVTEQPGGVAISISDDGKGINLDAIASKARNLGFLSPTQSISNEQLIDLIFLPGLSTANVVTEVSGRGVGMDVVKQALQKIDGKINVETEKNKGTTFTLQLPSNVGTQIINGMLVKSNQTVLVFPLENILETFSISHDEIVTLPGDNQVINRKDSLLPFCFMNQILYDYSITDQMVENSADQKLGIAIRNKKIVACLGVEQILGIRQVVIKNVSGISETHQFFIGAAIMEDRTTAFVVNIDEFISAIASKERSAKV